MKSFLLYVTIIFALAGSNATIVGRETCGAIFFGVDSDSIP